jgi:hypothetical protein
VEPTAKQAGPGLPSANMDWLSRSPIDQTINILLLRKANHDLADYFVETCWQPEL